jgi:hypothetical protein
VLIVLVVTEWCVKRNVVAAVEVDTVAAVVVVMLLPPAAMVVATVVTQVVEEVVVVMPVLCLVTNLPI